MIQTVMVAQELYAKATLVNCEELSAAQARCDLVKAESLLQDAFSTDVRPAIVEWRLANSLPANPMTAFKESGYLQRITAQRGHRASAASSYA